MSSKLVIVESPAKAKTIGKILGHDYIIRASMGHVRDLPERTLGVDVEHDFMPQYEETRTRSKNLSDLKSAAKSVGEIYLASDPDREGEAIAWHLRDLLTKSNKKAVFHRVSFHEITRSAIERAFQQPGEVNMDLVNSQQARRVLDRIVGYQTSPLLWTRIERGISAGRVQSVALRLVCEREREILSFVPREYWNFSAQFEAEKDAGKDRRFIAKLAKINGKNVEISNQTDADAVLAAVKAAGSWNISSIETQPRKKYAAPPFITSTLQQAASSHLGFSSSQTMRIAQQLYEGVDVNGAPVGLITYMRTDSVAVAVEAQNVCRNFISAQYGSDYVPEKPNIYRSKSNAQGAHEAIRPTDVNLTPDMLKKSLDPKQLKLYTLIWQRFLGSQMAPARLQRTTVTLDAVSGKSAYTFRTTSTITQFPGFLRAYNVQEEGAASGDDDEDNRFADILAGLKQDDLCRMLKSLSEQKFTEPVPRFSEATLIKELESNGIGRPSTYATIVNTIQDRKYVLKEKGKLIPTELGFKVNDYLVSMLPELFQVGFTAAMEKQLDEIEEGKIEWTAMMHDFYGKYSKWLGEAKSAGAPESGKAAALLKLLNTVTQWEVPEKVEGKRTFNDQKFVRSVQDKSAKSSVSGRQWEALLSLALKYRDQIPSLDEVAASEGFTEDLQAAVVKREKMAIQREQWKQQREEALASAPDQSGIADVFAAMENLKWNPPEKSRGRVYDDKKFFDSLRSQSAKGKVLSEKQVAALGRILNKYADQIPDFKAVQEKLGVPAPVADASAPAADASASSSGVEDLLAKFEQVTQWSDPVKVGRRVYDDHEFVESIRTQSKAGKRLSPRQVAALKKLAGKYSLLDDSAPVEE